MPWARAHSIHPAKCFTSTSLRSTFAAELAVDLVQVQTVRAGM